MYDNQNTAFSSRNKAENEHEAEKGQVAGRALG